MIHLLECFLRRHGEMPKRILVYREGVSDSQFQMVLVKEMQAYKEVIIYFGHAVESVKISVVMVQKRHLTR